jgi:ABC-type nitrate/sulfonate/bicarbonate transport system substrate-binding protein/outer membrane protein OmpA-like peptidoglycan-associated protein
MMLSLTGCGEPETSSPAVSTPEGTTTVDVRKVSQGKLAAGEAIKVPYILWGGDIASFYGNGGLRTTEGSIFHSHGLVAEFSDGNDFAKQIADYKAGRSPFLRGTFRMIGLASHEFGSNPDDRPMVFLQMTWSAGDHLVGRTDIRTLSDLKGKTIAVQSGGPHIGMLDDVLKTSGLAWKDIEVVWADNITGADSPPELFRSNPKIDAAFAITPDMLGLTGGLTASGSGAEGTVKGARVVVSTAELSHSIADVYAVRRGYWKAHPEVVDAFVASYLESVEQVIDLKREYETNGSDEYLDLLQRAQNIFGADVLPTLEEDAHGLLSDCSFAGHPGNIAFFEDETNIHGFADFNLRSLDLAQKQFGVTDRIDLLPSPVDWANPDVIRNLKKTNVVRIDRFQAEAVVSEIEAMDADGVLDDRTLVSFTIPFQPNQTDFDARQYATEYERVFELAARYGNAVIVIRGHADPTLVLRDAVKAGLANGGLKRSGTKGSYSYFLDGRPLKLEDSSAMMRAVQKSTSFNAVDGYDPRKTMQRALNLSRERAFAVRASLLEHAQSKRIRVDESQIQGQGVGVREPLVGRPRAPEEAAVNRRVEFRLVRVSAEAMTASDFDF